MNIKFYLVCLLVFFLTACKENEFSKAADQAFNSKEYAKAFQLYKKAIKQSPGDETLYRNLEKSASYIIAGGLTMFRQRKYKECIDYLKPIAEDKEYAVGDAQIITSLSHLYGFHQNPKNILTAMALLHKALQRSKMQFSPLPLPKKITLWIEEQGIKDIAKREGNQQDINAIWRSFFYRDAVNLILRTEQETPYFNVPEGWTGREIIQLRIFYSLISWFNHNMKIVTAEDPRHYQSLPPEVFLRGYGTAHELANVFAFLGLNCRVPTYILEPKRNGKGLFPLILANIGKHWVLFDLQDGTPIFEKEKLADLSEILKSSDWKYTRKNDSMVSSSDISQGTIWVTAPARNLAPRLSIFFHVFSKYNVQPPPYFFFDIMVLAEHADKFIQGKNYKENFAKLVAADKDKLSAALYPNNFKSLIALKQKKVLEEMLKKRSTTHSARMRDMFAQFDKAKEEYGKLGEESEDALYFRAVHAYHAGDKKKAKEQFESYLKKYSEGFWKQNSYAFLGKISTDFKKFVAAKEFYLKSQKFPPHVVECYSKEMKNTEEKSEKDESPEKEAEK